MCVVSMVGDHFRDRWSDPIRWPVSSYPFPQVPAFPDVVSVHRTVTRQEFDELKRQVLEMKELLERAVKYDAANGEPGCEIDEKMDLLRRVAKLVGVDLDDVIGGPKKKRSRKRGLPKQAKAAQ